MIFSNGLHNYINRGALMRYSFRLASRYPAASFPSKKSVKNDNYQKGNKSVFQKSNTNSTKGSKKKFTPKEKLAVDGRSFDSNKSGSRRLFKRPRRREDTLERVKLNMWRAIKPRRRRAVKRKDKELYRQQHGNLQGYKFVTPGAKYAKPKVLRATSRYLEMLKRPPRRFRNYLRRRFRRPGLYYFLRWRRRIAPSVMVARKLRKFRPRYARWMDRKIPWRPFTATKQRLRTYQSWCYWDAQRNKKLPFRPVRKVITSLAGMPRYVNYQQLFHNQILETKTFRKIYRWNYRRLVKKYREAANGAKRLFQYHFLKYFEFRFENAVYRANLDWRIPEARHHIKRGWFTLNNVIKTRPYDLVRIGDCIMPHGRFIKRRVYQNQRLYYQPLQLDQYPSYLLVNERVPVAMIFENLNIDTIKHTWPIRWGFIRTAIGWKYDK